MARPFDLERLEFSGGAVALGELIAFFPNFGHAAFSVSNGLTLAYNSGFANTSQLVWHDRAGRVVGRVGPVGLHLDGPRLSTDGRRVIATIVDRQTGTSDLWLLDLLRTTMSRFTFTAASEFLPVWSPDGNRVMFASDRSGAPDLYRKPASGTGDDELVLRETNFRMPTSWSSDGRFVLFHEAGPQGYNLQVLAADGTTRPFLVTPFNEVQGRLSPDGKWVAYASDDSGRLEVFVQPFAAGGGKWQISTDGGSQPEWRQDGRELFYISADRKLMSIAVKATSAAFEAATPRALFDVVTPEATAPYFHHYAAAPDGQRFLVNTMAEQGAPAPITVVVNWPGLLKR